ncbi:hypothetical protein ACH5RR_000606 [Cinchona calisaya]|uniref:Uncharacterized protein n=1 Tax=Cinchona calisaya TaxID=153742 RepID=A0ABD3B139_9GENT
MRSNHPRREPFEHGLLPISKLIFSQMGPRHWLQLRISFCPFLPFPNLQLTGSTQFPFLKPSRSHLTMPASSSTPSPLFFTMSYKRLLPKGHRESAAIDDVWPSTSNFNGFLSVLLPLQVGFQLNFQLMFVNFVLVLVRGCWAGDDKGRLWGEREAVKEGIYGEQERREEVEGNGERLVVGIWGEKKRKGAERGGRDGEGVMAGDSGDGEGLVGVGM